MRHYTVTARARPIATLAAGLALGSGTGAFAQAAEDVGSAIPPVAECASLALVDLSAVGSVVLSAAAETREGHDYCFVQGYMSPQTQFEVLLPLTT